MSCHEEPGPDCCHELMVERIRYFTGRHMSAQDFHDADAHHRSFRHLHNRILHGWGIACGLEVRIHPREECRSDRVVVRCGMAIDCCGREVVVPRDVVTGRIPWATRPKQADRTPDGEFVLALCLRYCETLTHKVPVLYSTRACSTPELEHGRVREEYCLDWHWVRRSDLGKYGWRTAQQCPPPKIEEPAKEQKYPPEEKYSADEEKQRAEYEQKGPKPYDRPVPEPPEPEPCDDDERCCLKPECPPDHCILLAVISVKAPDALDQQDDINTSGRRSIAQAREHLTHICWTSWDHGGVIRVSDLDKLKVRFERPLLVERQPKHYSGPRGINARTFYVEFGGGHEDIDFVPYRRVPYLEADRRTAVYEILRDWGVRRLIDHTIHVTVECDFLLDCHGNPVDGDHLGGRLPTGNGIAGGAFESWFTVVSDDAYDRVEQERRGTEPGTAKEYRS
jgi:hypothetical protein